MQSTWLLKGEATFEALFKKWRFDLEFCFCFCVFVFVFVLFVFFEKIIVYSPCMLTVIHSIFYLSLLDGYLNIKSFDGGICISRWI